MSKKYQNHTSNEIKENVFQSRISKVLIEVHDYSFCHTSSSSNIVSQFIGRKDLLERLKNLIVNSSAKSGVYLVTGNRGVGKSSLVSKVIKQTSVEIIAWKNARYILLLFCLLLSIQIFCYEIFALHPDTDSTIGNVLNWGILLVSIACFLLLGYNSVFRKKYSVYRKECETKSFERLYNCGLFRIIIAAIKELGYAKGSSVSSNNKVVMSKTLFIVLLSLFFHNSCLGISILQLFTIYLLFVGANIYWRFFEQRLIKNLKKLSDNKNNASLYLDLNKLRKSFRCCYILFTICVTSLPICYMISGYSSSIGIISAIIILAVLIEIIIGIYLITSTLLKETSISKRPSFFGHLLADISYRPILNYTFHHWDNHTRVYLKINLGHKILNEKDVLRLIARTILTEFNRYRNSLTRMLIWRIIALGILIVLSFFVYKVIYIPLLKTSVDNIYNKYECSQNTKYSEDFECFFYKDIPLSFDRIEDYTYTLDRSVNLVYSYILYAPSYFWNKKSDKKDMEYCIMKYEYIIIFILTYIICCLIMRLPFGEIMTHRKIRKQLEDLNEAITSEITRETNTNLSASAKSITIGSGRSKVRRQILADEREIEKELFEILNSIQRIPTLMRRPEFIVIFDELDKVEPENEDTASKTKGSMFSLDAIRERQSTILKLLINLKFFLTNANAKFIFIAGREMYDIYLADISDRNNFIGSIFHDVINVPSFLSDNSDDKSSDPTALTEEFVCRYLIPSSYPVFRYNLTSYAKYLDTEVFNKNESQLVRMQREKVITILQQFILYLAYLSKGAPKKLIQLFEDFIEIFEDNQQDNQLYIKQYRKSKYFLSFDYQDQYAVGMIAYLINPVFLKFKTSNIQKHSDKLLISSLFMLDYIYKFHSHSFSWRDLNASPEMLEVNKAPELRPMITDLINFLTQFHIEKSTTGFNDFKFENLISHEISFLSKIYEEFSAIYNFSLDESLAVRQYYMQLLETEQTYNKQKELSDSNFIHATSSLQVRLGDLYFYDDELEKASVYYKNGIDDLRQKDIDKLDLDQFLFLVKNMLKLAFVYEKRKLYDFAFATYTELSKFLVQTQERNFSSTKAISKNSLWSDFFTDPETQNTLLEKLDTKNPTTHIHQAIIKNSTFAGLKMLYLPLLAKFQIKERSHFNGITDIDLGLLNKEFEFVTSQIHERQVNLVKADFYTKVAEILYYKNRQFTGYNNLTQEKGKSLKDRLYPDRFLEKQTQLLPKDGPCSACYFYKRAIINLLKHTSPEDATISDDISEILFKIINNVKKYNEQTMCNLLARILSDWGNVFLSCDKGKNCKKEGEGENLWNSPPNTCPSDSEKFETDTLDNCFKLIEKIEPSAEDSTFTQEYKTLKKETRDFSKFELSMLMYSLSSNLYKRSNLHKRSAFQLNKMIVTLKTYASGDYFGTEDKNDLFKNIDDKKYLSKLTRKAIRSIYQAYDDLNLFEINERKKVLSSDEVSLNYLLLESKIDRLKITAKEIELKRHTSVSLIDSEDGTAVKKKIEFLSKYYSLSAKNREFITSKYAINHSVSARIYTLRLKANMNWLLLKDFIEIGKYGTIEQLYKEILDFLYDNDNKIQKNLHKILGVNISNVEVLERLLTDSIFCYNEMIKLSKTSGESYFFNHSFLASTYKKMSDWIILYEAYSNLKSLLVNTHYQEIRNIFDKKSNHFYNYRLIRDKVNDSQCEIYFEYLIGKDWKEQLSGYHDSNQALAHYYKCIETHTGGRAYYTMIDQLYYVRDDYNDRVTHFDIAVERSLYVTGAIDKEKTSLKKRYKDSKILDINRYFDNTEPSNTNEQAYNSST